MGFTHETLPLPCHPVCADIRPQGSLFSSKADDACYARPRGYKRAVLDAGNVACLVYRCACVPCLREGSGGGTGGDPLLLTGGHPKGVMCSLFSRHGLGSARQPDCWNCAQRHKAAGEHQAGQKQKSHFDAIMRSCRPGNGGHAAEEAPEYGNVCHQFSRFNKGGFACDQDVQQRTGMPLLFSPATPHQAAVLHFAG